MPKPAMGQEEVAEKKNQLVDIAAQVIMDEGYHGLTMRKIGARSNMTAPNIYNYFSSKDELNIAIRARAGRILFQMLNRAYHRDVPVREKFTDMARAYMQFGIGQKNYYAILFDMNAPKFSDYKGTGLEPLARKEKESTEKTYGLLNLCFQEFKAEGYCMPKEPEPFLSMVWGQFHGLVSIYNNNLISELSQVPEETIEAAARLACDIILSVTGPAGHTGGTARGLGNETGTPYPRQEEEDGKTIQ